MEAIAQPIEAGGTEFICCCCKNMPADIHDGEHGADAGRHKDRHYCSDQNQRQFLGFDRVRQRFERVRQKEQSREDHQDQQFNWVGQVDERC